MVAIKINEQIAHDFDGVAKDPRVQGVLLYGSQLTRYAISRSDIDVCIVVPGQDLPAMYSFVMNTVKANLDAYDIRFFEELPLHIQGNIIENGKVIFARDEPGLYEYFFHFRKLWEDQKWRLHRLAMLP
jgi:predicted nucleotidyltransferase